MLLNCWRRVLRSPIFAGPLPHIRDRMRAWEHSLVVRDKTWLVIRTRCRFCVPSHTASTWWTPTGYLACTCTCWCRRRMASGKACKKHARHAKSTITYNIGQQQGMRGRGCTPRVHHAARYSVCRHLPVYHSWHQAFMLRLAANGELSLACKW